MPPPPPFGLVRVDEASAIDGDVADRGVEPALPTAGVAGSCASPSVSDDDDDKRGGGGFQVLSMRRGGQVTASCDVSGLSFSAKDGIHHDGEADSPSADGWIVGEASLVLARTGGYVELWTSHDGDGERCGEDENSDEGSDGSACTIDDRVDNGDDEEEGVAHYGGGDGGDSGVLERMHRPCRIRVDDDRIDGLSALPRRRRRRSPHETPTTIDALAKGAGDAAEAEDPRCPWESAALPSAALHLIATTRSGCVFLLLLRRRCGRDGGLGGECEWTLEVLDSTDAAAWECQRRDHGERTGSADDPVEITANGSRERSRPPGGEDSGVARGEVTTAAPWRFVGPPEPFPLRDRSAQVGDAERLARDEHRAALLPLRTGGCLLVRIDDEADRAANSDAESSLLRVDAVAPFPLPTPERDLWPSHRIRRVRPLAGSFDGRGRPLVCAVLGPDAFTDETFGGQGEEHDHVALDGLLVCCALESRCRMESDGDDGMVQTASPRREDGRHGADSPEEQMKSHGNESNFFSSPGRGRSETRPSGWPCTPLGANSLAPRNGAHPSRAEPPGRRRPWRTAW